MKIKPLVLDEMLQRCRTSALSVAMMDATFSLLACSPSALPLLRDHELSTAFRYLDVPAQGPFCIQDFYQSPALVFPLALTQGTCYLLYFPTLPSPSVLQDRQEFVEDLAHELGHPLSILLGCAEVLAEEYADQLPQGAADLVRSIDRSAEEVLHLTQNLTTLSRICTQQHGGLTLQSLDLCDWLSAYCARMNSLLSSSGGQIFFSTALRYFPMDMEPFLLERILANLIYNSLRHSGKQEVFIQLQLQDDVPCITVMDHGVGMRPEQLEHLFTRRSPSADGHGLGLAIASACADALGAQLHATSAPDQGTSVSIRLPKHPCTGRLLSLRSPLFQYSSQLFARPPFSCIF